MRESTYQGKVIKKLQALFPGCYVLKNDSGYIQGIPDLLVLWKCHWAMLEVKRSANEAVQPNQLHHVEHLDEMSFAAIIFPENEEEVLNALQQAFGVRG